MPQPATHYWVARRAIPQYIDNDTTTDYWKEWWDKYKNYFGLGTAAPDLFYFPLMPKVDVKCEDFYWDGIADIIHSTRSFDFFCKLMNAAKKSQLDPSIDTEIANRQFAFSFGFYCHVVTDCIFHPYVYRSSKDHWSAKAGEFKDNPVESIREYQHKYQEFLIDKGTCETFNLNLNRISWSCPDANNSELLDMNIAKIFNDTLMDLYRDCIPYEYKIENPSHPIHQAYDALLQTSKLIFEGDVVITYKGNNITTSGYIKEKIEKAGSVLYSPHFYTEPYPNCGSLPGYTPNKLFDFSCAVARKIFKICIKFWNSPYKNIEEFFSADPKENITNYLNGNWNLDTGIPCQFNNTQKLHSDNESMNLAHIDTLKATYNNFAYLYDSLFKKK